MKDRLTDLYNKILKICLVLGVFSLFTACDDTQDKKTTTIITKGAIAVDTANIIKETPLQKAKYTFSEMKVTNDTLLVSLQGENHAELYDPFVSKSLDTLIPIFTKEGYTSKENSKYHDSPQTSTKMKGNNFEIVYIEKLNTLINAKITNPNICILQDVCVGMPKKAVLEKFFDPAAIDFDKIKVLQFDYNFMGNVLILTFKKDTLQEIFYVNEMD